VRPEPPHKLNNQERKTKTMFKQIVVIMCAVLMCANVALAQSSATATVNDVISKSGASAETGDQSQGQGQQQANQIGLNDMGNIKDSFNSQGMRGFAIPGDVQYGPVINYFTKPLPSAGFQPVEEVLMYGCFFTEGALEELAAGGGTDASLKIVNAVPQALPAPEDGKTRWIKIVIQKAPMTGLKFKGFVTATSDSNDTTMVQVMGKASLEALKKGANVIHFTAQGAVRDAFSSGWGIGFGTTFAKLYNADGNQDISGVGYAGMGYSKAKAGMRDLPWLQGFALVDDALVYPKLEVASSVKTAGTTQTGNHVPKK